ncbi:MAG: histidinol phosphate phosphatase [Clostridia bacterium]|nr:histidinol phosphate phosphatase [Clostridia bacterium]
MTDAHIHLERGPYTLEWAERFLQTALLRGITEIHLLEHSYLFPEFVPMYDGIRAENTFADRWLARKAGTKSLAAYLALAEQIRRADWPVTVRFGLEICYLEGTEALVRRQTKDLGLDFLTGSVHFAGSFAFDHRPELWEGMDTDEVYRQYFRRAVHLAESGLFDGMAHPDSIRLFGHIPSFPLTEYHDRLAAALAEHGMYAEQNSGVHRRCPDTAEAGMAPELLAAMKRHGVRLLTASDAHRPEDAGEGIAELAEMTD